MKHRIYIQVFVFIFSFFILIEAGAQTLTVTGSNWAVPVEALTEAGKNYVGTYESTSGQILHTVNGVLGLLTNAKITVHYEPNAQWNSNLKLYVKRNGTGTGVCLLCTISGGTSYLLLSTIDQTLYTVTIPLSLLTLLGYTNIPIQVKTSGISVTVPSDNYSAKVIFTISAN